MHRTGRILWAAPPADAVQLRRPYERRRHRVHRRLEPLRERLRRVTGELLWQTRLPTSVQGFPISYAVEGRQYVAIPVGVGAQAWSTIPLRLTPEVRRPETGNGLYLFALPE